MNNNRANELIDAELEEPEVFLQQRGVVPDNGAFTTRQLARELTRRGWRWELEPDTVRATKAYTTTGPFSQSFVSHVPDQVAALTQILAGAIRFDEANGLALTRPIQADIVVRAPDQRVVALVEVKSGRTFSDELARHLRQNLVSNSREYSLAPFFLLVTRDVGFLWDQRSDSLPFSPATSMFSMRPVIAYYLRWLEPDERTSEFELGLAAAAWLRDLASGEGGPLEIERILEGTEFLEAIHGGSVETEGRL